MPPADLNGRVDGHVALDPSLWRNRHFLVLWLAQVISQTAQNAIWYGIVVLVEQRTSSTTQLSIAVLTLILPSVIFGVVAGVYVDRWDKRWVLIGSNALRGTVALTYFFFGAGEAAPLAALYLVNFVFSTIGQFFAPAEAAMIPALVVRHRLLQANSLFHLTFTGSQLVGLVLLGPLLAKLVGVEWLFAAMAVAIMLCGGLVWPLPSHRGGHDPNVARTGGEAVRSVLRDVRVVWSFVTRDRLVSLAMVQWNVGAILGLIVATLLPGFAERVLYVNAEDVVFVMAPAGVGMVAGTAIINRWGDRIERRFMTIGGLFTVAACLGTIGGLAFALELATGGAVPRLEIPTLGLVSGLVPVVMALALVAGFGFVAIMVPPQTFLQEQAPVSLRGRVFAVLLMLSNLASIVPLLLLGGLADLLGVETTLALVGVLIAVVGVVSVWLAPGVPPWKESKGADTA